MTGMMNPSVPSSKFDRFQNSAQTITRIEQNAGGTKLTRGSSILGSSKYIYKISYLIKIKVRMKLNQLQ